jgi:hypothetical protein
MRSLINRVALSFALIFALSYCAMAQQAKTTISGTIHTVTGDPDPNGSLTVYEVRKVGGINSAVQQTFYTNSSGQLLHTDGSVGMKLPRNSQARIWSNAPDYGFNRHSGVWVVIPDAATANLQDLPIIPTVSAGIRLKDEGTLLSSLIGTIDFVGSGFSVSQTTPGSATVTLTGGGASALTLREVDLSPSIAGTSTFEVNQAAGFALSDEGGGVTRLDLNAVPYSKLALSGSILNADLAGSIDAAKISGGLVSNTEFGHLDGVSSAIQTQLDGKAASSHTHTGVYEPALGYTAANAAALNASNLTSGTVPLARLSGITNAEIAAGAAIADTKLAAISTPGKVSDSALSSNVALKNANNLFSAEQEINLGAIDDATVDGLKLANSTAATALATLQNAPVLVFEAHGWNDDDSISHKWEMNEAFRTRSHGLKSRFSWEFAIDDGGYAEKSYIDSSGNVGAAGYVSTAFNFLVTDGLDGNTLASFGNDGMTFGGANVSINSTSTADANPFRFSTANSTQTGFQLNGSNTLTSGDFIEGIVPDAGFTGSLLKLGRSNNGTTVTTTLFEIDSAGKISSGVKLPNNLGVQGTRVGGSAYNLIALDDSDTVQIGGLSGQGVINADINVSTYRVIAQGNPAVRVQIADVGTSRTSVAIGSGYGETANTLSVSDRAGNDTNVLFRAGTAQGSSSEILRTSLTDGTTKTWSVARDGYFPIYNSAATAGTGVVPVYAAVASTAQVNSISDTNLQVGGAVAPAGLYKVTVYTVITSTGTGTLTTSVKFNDGTAARTITSAGVAATATNFEQVSYLVKANGSNNITYATTRSVADGAYSIYVTLERIQ